MAAQREKDNAPGVAGRVVFVAGDPFSEAVKRDRELALAVTCPSCSAPAQLECFGEAMHQARIEAGRLWRVEDLPLRCDRRQAGTEEPCVLRADHPGPCSWEPPAAPSDEHRCSPPRRPLADAQHYALGLNWTCSCGVSFVLENPDGNHREWRRLDEATAPDPTRIVWRQATDAHWIAEVSGRGWLRVEEKHAARAEWAVSLANGDHASGEVSNVNDARRRAREAFEALTRERLSESEPERESALSELAQMVGVVERAAGELALLQAERDAVLEALNAARLELAVARRERDEANALLGRVNQERAAFNIECQELAAKVAETSRLYRAAVGVVQDVSQAMISGADVLDRFADWKSKP